MIISQKLKFLSNSIYAIRYNSLLYLKIIGKFAIIKEIIIFFKGRDDYCD